MTSLIEYVRLPTAIALIALLTNATFAADSGGLKSAPESGITDTAIKIGWMGDESGPAASIELPDIHGLQAYADFVNSKGGILGRQIQIVDLDDKSRPDNATVNFRRLVNDEHVLAIADMAGSQISTPLGPAIVAAKMPVIFPQQTTDAQLQTPYIFNLTAHYADQADVIVATLARMIGGADKLNLMVVRLSVPSGDEFDAYAQRSVKAQGGHYASAVTVGYTQEDYAPTVVQIKQAMASGANAIAFHGTIRNALGLFNALSKAGVSVPIAGIQSLAAPDIFKNGPADILAKFEAVQSALPPSANVPGAKDMQTYIQSHPQYANEGGEPYFSQGWLSGWVLMDALQRVATQNGGTVSRDSVYQALSSKFDTGGLTCPLDFTGPMHYTPCVTAMVWDGKGLVSKAGFAADSATLQRKYGLK